MMAENKCSEFGGGFYYGLLFLSYLIMGLSLAYISEHFIFEEAIKRLTARLTSPAIGYIFYPAAEDKQKEIKVSVFAFDDGDLQEFKQTYPLSYSFHARMLDNIGEMSPKAVFLDIWFHDERPDPTINQLVDAICRLHKSGTRVYLASLSHLGGAENQLRKEFREIAVPATGLNDLSRKPSFCAVEVSVSKNTDFLDRQIWEYPLSSNPKHQQVYSAAAQIYNDLSGHKPLPLSASPLALVWGARGSETNRYPPESNTHENASCRNEWYWQELIPVPFAWRSSLGFPAETAKPFCTYHTTLPLRAFSNLSGESLKSLIENRVIIYGGNLQSDADSIYSPVHGRLPGLQMHAMALDNLFHYRAQYPKAESFNLKNIKSAGTLFPLFIVSIFSLLTTLIHWCRESEAGNACLFKLRGSTKRHLSRWRGNRSRFLSRWRGWLRNTELFPIIHKLRDKSKESIENLPGCSGALLTIIVKNLWSLITWVDSWAWREVILIVIKNLWSLITWLASWAWRAVILVVMLFTMAFIGLKFFHLGPLSWMEYAISPIAMEFLHWGENTAKWFMKTRMQLSRACCSNNHNRRKK